MESWMINLMIALFAGVGTFAVIKSNVNSLKETTTGHTKSISNVQKVLNESRPILDHLSKQDDLTMKLLTSQGQSITSLHEKISQAPTMKEVRNEFVSKELFRQLEKHFDSKFFALEKHFDEKIDGIGRDVKSILNGMEKRL